MTRELNNLLSYIDSYWDKLIIRPQKQVVDHRLIRSVILRMRSSHNQNILEVPHTCLVPNDGRFTYIFYWDSYFMFRGIMDTKREWVIVSMVENFVFLYKKYGIIPNLTHPYALNRSQPPFLSSMIFDAYFVLLRERRVTEKVRKLFVNPNKWLEKRMDIAKKEYTNVWNSSSNQQTQINYNHFVDQFQLNRYGDRDVGYAFSSELESGWDLTSRFYRRCNEFLPVDLNCYLYKYERDFARSARILENDPERKYWKQKAIERKTRMNTLMWNEKEGFFYDYDYIHNKQSSFHSLAGFVPLWAGLATYEQALKMKEKLKLFETEYGLTITDKASLAWDLDLKKLPKPYQLTINETFAHQQWDWPHIWSPLEYMTVIGLLQYGFVDDAKRIMQKAIDANLKIYSEYGALLEKIDVTTGGAAGNHAYPNQFGFGWTNAAIYRYTKILSSLDQGEDIYLVRDKHNKPPFTLLIPH